MNGTCKFCICYRDLAGSATIISAPTTSEPFVLCDLTGLSTITFSTIGIKHTFIHCILTLFIYDTNDLFGGATTFQLLPCGQ